MSRRLNRVSDTNQNTPGFRRFSCMRCASVSGQSIEMRRDGKVSVSPEVPSILESSSLRKTSGSGRKQLATSTTKNLPMVPVVTRDEWVVPEPTPMRRDAGSSMMRRSVTGSTKDLPKPAKMGAEETVHPQEGGGTPLRRMKVTRQATSSTKELPKPPPPGRDDSPMTASSLPPGIVKDAPLAPAFAKQRYNAGLTAYELNEIMGFREIYFVGNHSAKLKPRSDARNLGFDDNNSHYRFVVGDHLGYRYEVLGMVGQGAFAMVLRCMDHKTKRCVAVKVIVNTPVMSSQAAVEIASMKALEATCSSGISQYKDSFTFRNHMCIVCDLLGPSLFSKIKDRGFVAFPKDEVRSIARDLLMGLAHVHGRKIIHADLKPENILFVNNNSSNVRIIDFGSSCIVGRQAFNYLQSRFYRAPEVIMHLPYGPAIDMWSIGCIICELVSGHPIFPGTDEFDQLGRFVEVIGQPPLNMVQQSPRRERFFGTDSRLRQAPGQTARVPWRVKLPILLQVRDVSLLEFITRCLEWDPSKRISADAALKHRWIATR